MLLEIITHPIVKKFQIMHIFCPLVQGGGEKYYDLPLSIFLNILFVFCY